MRALALILLAFLISLRVAAADVGALVAERGIMPPTQAQAAELAGVSAPVHIRRIDAGVPGWDVVRDRQVVAYIGSTREIAGSVGYSGLPLDVLIAITPSGRISGAQLVQHNEPILTLGISDEDIAAYVSGFEGLELSVPNAATPDAPDVISRATVSTGVIRDGILRTARTLAAGRGILASQGIDRLTFTPLDWAGLIDMGALAEARVTMDEAALALAGAKVPVPPGAGDFLHLWAGILDPPTIGQNLLGQKEFTRVVGALGSGEAALIVMSMGMQSHRGTDWRQSGLFDRMTIVQGDTRWQPTAESYQMVRRLALPNAPAMKEISVFALPATIDPSRPFTIDVQSRRPTVKGRTVTMDTHLSVALPQALLTATMSPEPLWKLIWAEKWVQAVMVVVMLVALTAILFAQEWITRRPALWRTGRLIFLTGSFLFLGIGLNGQLSIVQVVAFVHSLLTGFRWETFLIEPVIFLLWSFVALGLLFWGRGVYCGWLCPFGALQELTNAVAVRLGVRQITVPQALHERLWVIKYTLFVGILALSFYSMQDALVVAEVEPFKTAISLRFVRAWPFLLFVAAILGAGFFIERFYCRYLCPLGAGLAIPAKLKIFDWLKRRPQCGRECRMCETKCTVGAIDAIGRINVNECVLCLRCQVIMNDSTLCPVLKRRARAMDGVQQ
ncbi:4Fe-4S binding protein [Gemmobacter denitrificans]|uniref:4Fe-4S binding protein n=1 Tax=Gemmobacter denitrificans TaxID=3123040 RepID=A0ABU8BXH4_9RHOB